MEESYALDAYNSLSIEGYQVSDQLIRRVAAGEWDPDKSVEDRQSRDALAARGYFLAFGAVRESLGRILAGTPSAVVVSTDHHRWHGALFATSVAAGLLRPEHLAGYRTGPVFIRNSLHTPPPAQAVSDCMEALFDLLSAESHAGVQAVLGHMLFAFVHPYWDGNGRIARFLMNAMLVAGGYGWTIIRATRRTEYMAALEAASVAGDIAPFARFVAEEMAAMGPGWSAPARDHSD
jgi:Fic family protein